MRDIEPIEADSTAWRDIAEHFEKIREATRAALALPEHLFTPTRRSTAEEIRALLRTRSPQHFRNWYEGDWIGADSE